MKKQTVPARLVFAQLGAYSHHVLDGKTAKEIAEFMLEESRKLDPLADPSRTRFELEVDTYFDYTDVRVLLRTARDETDEEYTRRLEQERVVEAELAARKRAEQKERRAAQKKAELETLARLTAKYAKKSKKVG